MKEKSKKVMVFGTFDGLHPGHEFVFREAKKHGSKLIVVVARDETVKAVKGKPPRHDEKTRLEEVKNSPLVDIAVLGNPGDKYRVIEEFMPDVICLGYDQQAFTDRLQEELKRRSINAEVVRLKPFMPHKYKSSILNGKDIKK
ncbi:FAD synthase [Candidatus Woesearchaeota archaeon]|nr:MAG: FAD synthase [Candidatus Woesearchaeota archaeon]